MATKAVHVSDVPNPHTASFSLYSKPIVSGMIINLIISNQSFPVEHSPKFVVIGHRGHGMNMLQSTDRRMKAFKENSILSFNKAANHSVDYIEFDVQVTKDDVPIIFHDDFILHQEHVSCFYVHPEES
ncbi:putative glycerophosphodiester phosphodiesterase [Helianthus anomalus]